MQYRSREVHDDVPYTRASGTTVDLHDINGIQLLEG